MKKPFRYNIIVLIGTVGSGKSTQGVMLSFALRRLGLRALFVNIKTFRFLSAFPLLLFKLIYGRKLHRRVAIMTFLIYNRITLQKLYGILSFLNIIDMLILFIFKVYLLVKLKYNLIIEEYIPAIMADYIYFKLLGFTTNWYKIAIGLCLKLYNIFSDHTYIVYLNAPDNVLVGRWKMRRTPPVRYTYLAMQRTILLRLAMYFAKDNFTYINTSSISIKETLLNILNNILKS